MRFLPLALLLAATPVAAQVSGGSQSDVAAGATLDLTVSCPITTATADCPAGSVYEMPIGNGQGVVGVDIIGLSGSGATVMVDRSVGGLWSGRNLLVTGSAGAFANTVSADTSFTLNSVAARAIRFRVNSAGTGTARVFASATANSSIVQFATSLPAGNLTLGGVNVVNTPAVTVGNFPASQAVTGSVSVSNLPAVQPVTVGNFPATQPVTLSGTPSVSVSNFPATQPVTVGNFPATQPVSGTVAVSNLPATQAVSATTLPLPTGAATAALQSTLNGQIPATLGAKTGAASLSVVPNTDTPFPITDRGSSNFTTGQVAVGTTPTLIAAARAGRRVIVLYPTTSVTYYISNTSTISTATSAPLGGGVVVTLPTSGAVYAQGASAVTIGYLEFY